ncbi:MAG: hypothetical protein FJ125_06515 [Deltaproteobacteria bacterium]|nr:hypothetical protein [Deltaproteobacteria bacterium]
MKGARSRKLWVVQPGRQQPGCCPRCGEPLATGSSSCHACRKTLPIADQPRPVHNQPRNAASAAPAAARPAIAGSRQIRSTASGHAATLPPGLKLAGLLLLLLFALMLGAAGSALLQSLLEVQVIQPVPAEAEQRLASPQAPAAGALVSSGGGSTGAASPRGEAGAAGTSPLQIVEGAAHGSASAPDPRRQPPAAEEARGSGSGAAGGSRPVPRPDAPGAGRGRFRL